MREVNSRVRAPETFELSLSGRQVAAIVAVALVVLGVVFVLGLNVGKQLAVRQVDTGHSGDLEALDHAAAAPAPGAEPLTFHERLTKEAPEPTPGAAEKKPPAPAEAAPPSAGPAPSSAQPAEASAAAVTGSNRPWTVQLAAAEDRADADRLAERFASLNPRVEEAVVPGKGRFFRVRVGSFDSKEAAQRYARDVARETGAKGIVTPSR